MIDLSSFDRNYTNAKREFQLEIPEYFNFAFDVLDERAADADKTALIALDPNGDVARTVRYSDISNSSSQFANALRRLGMQKGDAACVVVGRCPEWYSVLFGCMKAGVISMPGTNLLTAKDIAYRINQAGAKMVIITAEHLEKIEKIRAECPSLEHLVVIGKQLPGWISFQTACDAESAFIDAAAAGPFRSDDTMMVYFTSGTTALPKMVPRDFGYGLAHAATALFWMDLKESDVHWTLTDTGWAKAAWGMLFPPMLAGASIVLFDSKGFDADKHLELIGRQEVTTFCAPPTVYRLFAQLDLAQYDLKSLRRCLAAGEPLNPEVIRYWQKHSGCVIADGYGQTETINIVGNFSGLAPKFGSMGLPVPGFDVDIVDNSGKRMPAGEIGHIGLNVEKEWPAGLFRGYLKNNEIDTASFCNGWYLTGDMARKDEDGYLWFVGRADDLISSSGYRISPFEVESVLLEHPAVAESAVIGVKDEDRGEVVKAYVIPAVDFQAGEALAEELKKFCRENTAPYKYPRIIEFVSELPKTISGKIRRVDLRRNSAD